MTRSAEVTASDRVALVDGDIGDPVTAAKIIEAALSRFQSIDVLVNNAGIFFTKPFTEYSAEDFRSLVSPMGRPSTVRDITDAVLYLTDAATVTGHIRYDGGVHFGRW